MTALQAHPAIRLPVARLAPLVVGVGAIAAGLAIGAIAIIRPSELATAVVAAGSVVLAVGAMYAVLGAIRTRYLVSLTTIFMGLSMARLIASVALGLGYMLTAATPEGARPDKMVFALVFLGVSFAVIAVETVLLRSIIHRLGEAIAGAASGAASQPSEPTASPAGAASSSAGHGGRS